jgi:hypothetical protein
MLGERDACGEEEGMRERKRGPRCHHVSYRHRLWREEEEREEEREERERERALGGSRRGQCRSKGVGGSVALS